MPKNWNKILGTDRKCENKDCKNILKPYQAKFCGKKCHAKIAFSKSEKLKSGESGARRSLKAWETRRKNGTDKGWKNSHGQKGWITRVEKYGNIPAIDMKKAWETRRNNGNDKWSDERKEKHILMMLSEDGSRAKKSVETRRRNGTLKQTEETKRKLRVSTLKRILRDHQVLSIGKNETKLLNEQELKDKCKIVRQYHIEYLGCIPDGYCKETNTIYYVHEKYHLGNKQMIKDFKQMKEIQDYLHCKFVIIYDGWTEKQIIDYEKKMGRIY